MYFMKNLSNIKDWLDIQEHQKIGEILMQSGKLTLHDLGIALDIQNFEKMQLGDILLNMKIISKQDIESALNIQKEIDLRLEKGEG